MAGVRDRISYEGQAPIELEQRLAARGFTVLTYSRVPPDDAGISLGQAVAAAARDRGGCEDGVSEGGGSSRGELG